MTRAKWSYPRSLTQSQCGTIDSRQLKDHCATIVADLHVHVYSARLAPRVATLERVERKFADAGIARNRSKVCIGSIFRRREKSETSGYAWSVVFWSAKYARKHCRESYKEAGRVLVHRLSSLAEIAKTWQNRNVCARSTPDFFFVTRVLHGVRTDRFPTIFKLHVSMFIINTLYHGFYALVPI